MTDGDWDAGPGRMMAVFLNGDAITELDPRGRRIEDDSFLLLFNTGAEQASFQVPAPPYDGPWEVILDTAMSPERETSVSAQPVRVEPHSFCLLRRPSALRPTSRGHPVRWP